MYVPLTEVSIGDVLTCTTHMYAHTRTYTHIERERERDKGETRNAIIIIMPDRYNTRCSSHRPAARMPMT